MKVQKYLFKISIIIALVSLNNLSAVVIKPSEVYTEAVKISKELDIVKKSFNISKSLDDQVIKTYDTNLKPRHVWQKTYFVLVKINVLRKNNNLPRIEEVGIEPVLHLPPDLVYEMTQRILTELRIFKRLKGIDEKITPTKMYKDKNPIDVFNLMSKNSMKLDIINRSQTQPSDVYGQVMRIHQDISTIFKYLALIDTTAPPIKNKSSQPKNAYVAITQLIDIVQKIQLKIGIEVTNFDTFKRNSIEPSDVMNMVAMALAEIQTLKAYIGLNGEVTPPAKSYQHKTPSDVEQLLYWNVKRMQIINKSNIR